MAVLRVRGGRPIVRVVDIGDDGAKGGAARGVGALGWVRSQGDVGGAEEAVEVKWCHDVVVMGMCCLYFEKERCLEQGLEGCSSLQCLYFGIWMCKC